MHAERRQHLHTWELHIPHLDTPIWRGSSSGRLTSTTVTHLGAPQLGHPSPEEVIAHLLTPSWRLKSTTVTRFGTPQLPLRHPNLGGCHRPSADLLWEAQVDDNYTLGSSTTQPEGPPIWVAEVDDSYTLGSDSVITPRGTEMGNNKAESDM